MSDAFMVSDFFVMTERSELQRSPDGGGSHSNGIVRLPAIGTHLNELLVQEPRVPLSSGSPFQWNCPSTPNSLYLENSRLPFPKFSRKIPQKSYRNFLGEISLELFGRGSRDSAGKKVEKIR